MYICLIGDTNNILNIHVYTANDILILIAQSYTSDSMPLIKVLNFNGM